MIKKKALKLMLVLVAGLSYFGAADSLTAFLFYDQQLQIYRVVIPGNDILGKIAQDEVSEFERLESLSVKDVALEYCLELLPESRKNLILLAKRARAGALVHSIFWILCGLMLTICLVLQNWNRGESPLQDSG